MKYAILEYEGSGNFGDEIQQISASQFMPKSHITIARDNFQNPTKEKYLTLMTGYFSNIHNPIFPPSKNILPAYTAVHIADPKRFLTAEIVEHLRTHAPIGCRDRGTYEALQSHGIPAFESKCLTLTLPKREKPPKNARPVLVAHSYSGIDIHRLIKKLIPREARQNMVEFSHKHDLDALGTEAKLSIANSLLSYYRNNASVIYTNLVHCALPCVGMGIPVVFFDEKDDSRTHIVSDIGLTRHAIKPYRTVFGKYTQRRIFADIDFSPQALAIEDIRADIISRTRGLLGEVLSRHGQDGRVPPFTAYRGFYV